jgi:hypothetical protein
MYIAKQISLSLLLLTSGIAFASDTDLLTKLESLSLEEGTGAAKVMTPIKPSIANKYEEQNGQNKINCIRLHDRKISICNMIGERRDLTIAPKGNTGDEIEQMVLKAFMGDSAAEYRAGIFGRIGNRRLESNYRYSFEELRSLTFPGSYFGDYLAVIFAQKD